MTDASVVVTPTLESIKESRAVTLLGLLCLLAGAALAVWASANLFGVLPTAFVSGVLLVAIGVGALSDSSKGTPEEVAAFAAPFTQAQITLAGHEAYENHFHKIPATMTKTEWLRVWNKAHRWTMDELDNQHV